MHQKSLPGITFNLLLPFILGSLLTISFAPFEQSYLAVVILAITIYYFEKQTPTLQNALKFSFSFSLSYFISHLHWLVIPMNTTAQLNGLLSLIILIAFCSGLALFLMMPLLGLFVSRNRLSDTIRFLWLLPLLWLLSEYTRSAFFPWALIAYSQTQLISLKPLISYFGSLGTGWLLLWCSACLAHFLLTRQYQGILLSLCSVVVAMVTVIIAMPIKEIKENTVKPPLNFTTVQHNEQQNIYQPNSLSDSMSKQVQLTDHLQSGPQLVIWPENALAPANDSSMWLNDLAQWLSDRQFNLLSGITWINEHQYSPSAVLMGYQQSNFQLGYKQHLVPFGEFIPFEALFHPIIDAFGIPLTSTYSEPPLNTYFNLGTYRILPIICYDIVFRDTTASLSAADFGVVLSNSNWFGQSIASLQHLQIAQIRAIEAGRPIIFANNAGGSAYINSHGEKVIESKDFSSYYMKGSITSSPVQHLFNQYRYYGFILFFCLYSALIKFMLTYHRKFSLVSK